MTALLTLWPLVRRFLPIAGLLAFALVFMIQRGEIRHANSRKDYAVALVGRITAASDRYAAASKRAADAKNDQYAKAKEASNAALVQARGNARALVDDYLRTHRVRQDLSNRPGGYVLPQSTAAATVDHGAGADGDVAISEADFRTCTEVNLRLQNAHEWAEGLK